MANGRLKYDINELAEKWLKGTITPEEKVYYDQWYRTFDDVGTEIQASSGESASEIGDRIYHQLKQRLDNEGKSKIPKILRAWSAAAAVILLCLSIGGYFLFHKKVVQQYVQYQPHDIAPGGNKAVLILANGDKIVLDTSKNGTVAQQGYTKIRKTGNGRLVYTRGAERVSPQTEETPMNILEVPRGGRYHITLSDGTQVWLNSATTLKYPSVFNGKERKVQLSGEAYFEVAYNRVMPFKVITNTQIVQDLGTHFNINAYSDEPAIKTTLLEGSVNVFNNGESEILEPGQQAIIGNNQRIKLVKNADLEEVMAWKDNMFRFNNEDLGSIMRDISRWYDVDIEYTNPSVKDFHFGGMVTRFTNASKVLRMLELTNEVHFKITDGDGAGKGKKIIVMK